LTIDYGKQRAEFHYSFIKRRIFAEEYLGENPLNYRLFCYNDEPKYLYTSIKNEFGTKNFNFFNKEWNPLNFNCRHPPNPNITFEKPKLFEEMKNIARNLSSDFKFVRIDLYDLNNEVKLG